MFVQVAILWKGNLIKYCIYCLVFWYLMQFYKIAVVAALSPAIDGELSVGEPTGCFVPVPTLHP